MSTAWIIYFLYWYLIKINFNSVSLLFLERNQCSKLKKWTEVHFSTFFHDCYVISKYLLVDKRYLEVNQVATLIATNLQVCQISFFMVNKLYTLKVHVKIIN